MRAEQWVELVGEGRRREHEDIAETALMAPVYDVADKWLVGDCQQWFWR